MFCSLTCLQYWKPSLPHSRCSINTCWVKPWIRESFHTSPTVWVYHFRNWISVIHTVMHSASSWLATLLSSVVVLSGSKQNEEGVGRCRGAGLSCISGHGQGVQTLAPPTFSSFSAFSISMCACVVHYHLSSWLSSPPMTSVAISIPTSVHLLMPKAVLSTCSMSPSFWCLTGPLRYNMLNMVFLLLPLSKWIPQCSWYHLARQPVPFRAQSSGALFLVLLREHR